MKKIILAVVATSMLLTNVAFASSQTTSTNNAKNGTMSSTNQIHLQSNDPGGW
jgi:hypothetical protein